MNFFFPFSRRKSHLFARCKLQKNVHTLIRFQELDNCRPKAGSLKIRWGRRWETRRPSTARRREKGKLLIKILSFLKPKTYLGGNGGAGIGGRFAIGGGGIFGKDGCPIGGPGGIGGGGTNGGIMWWFMGII